MKYFLFFPFFILALYGCQTDTPAETPTLEATAPLPNQAVKTGSLERREVSKSIRCTGTIEVPPSDQVSVTAQLALERQTILKTGDATTAAALEDSEGKVALLTATYKGLKSELQQYGIGVDALEQDGVFQSSVGIYARSAGFVHEVTVNEGRMVSPEDQLMEIAGTDHLHLELRVPSQQIGRLQKGQEVNFTLPFEAQAGTAVIEKINPMVDDASSTLQVHCQRRPDVFRFSG